MSACKACGQTLPDARFSLQNGLALLTFGPIGERIVKRVMKAGPHGVRSDALFDHIYGADPNGGPDSGKKALCVMINQLNKKLKTIAKRIVARGRGSHVAGWYHMIDTDTLTDPFNGSKPHIVSMDRQELLNKLHDVACELEHCTSMLNELQARRLVNWRRSRGLT